MDNLKVELSFVSTILKTYGFVHLHEYLTSQHLKEFQGKHYLTWEDVKYNSQCRTKAEWIKVMVDLEVMGLAVFSDPSHASTIKKIKPKWIEFCKDRDYFIQLSMNPCPNHIFLINANKLSDITTKTAFKENIYISILRLYQNKPVTREFLCNITGLSEYQQRKLEEKTEDYLKLKKNFVPIDKHKIDFINRRTYKDPDGSPCFPGIISPKMENATMTTQSNSNCYVKQTGNVYSVPLNYIPLLFQHDICSKSTNWIKLNKISQELRVKNLNNSYESEMNEAPYANSISFDDISLLIDKDDEVKLEHMHYSTVNCFSKGSNGSRRFQTFLNDFDNMIVMDQNGKISSVSQSLSGNQ
jgi:hypothetical protein